MLIAAGLLATIFCGAKDWIQWVAKAFDVSQIANHLGDRTDRSIIHAHQTTRAN